MAEIGNLDIIIRAIDETKSTLTSIQSNLSGMGKSGQQATGTLTSGFKNTAKELLGAAGIGIGIGFVTKKVIDFGKESLQSYGTFNQSIQRAGSYVNASKEQIAGFETAVKQAASNSTFSFQEVADALGSFVGGEISAEEATKELGGVIEFAMIAKMDNLQEAVNVASTALVRFQDEGLTMTDVNNTMAEVAADVTQETGAFSRSVADASSAAKSAGFSYKDLNVMLAIFVRAGGNAGEVGTALANGLNFIKANSTATEKALTKVGLSADGMANAMKAGPIEMLNYLREGFEKSGKNYAWLVDVVGRDAAKVIGPALQMNAQDAQDVADSFQNIDGKAAGVIETIRNSEPPLERIKKWWEGIKLEAGKALTEVFKFFDEISKKGAESLTKLDESGKKIVDPALISQLKDLKTATDSQNKSLDELGLTLGKVDFAKFFSDIMVGTLRSIISFSTFAANMVASFTTFINWIKIAVNAVGSLFGPNGAIANGSRMVLTIMTLAWNMVLNFITVTIPQIFFTIVNWFAQIPTYIFNYMMLTWNWILTIWNMIWTFFTTTIPQIFWSIMNWFNQLPGSIFNVMNSIWLIITQKVIGWYNTAVNWTRNLVNAIISFFSGLPGRIWSAISGIGGTIANAIGSWIGSARGAVSSFIESVVSWFRDLPGRILGAVGDIGGRLMSKITGSLGNIGGTLRQLMPFQHGGVIQGSKYGTPIIVGENYTTEAIVPLNKGSNSVNFYGNMSVRNEQDINAIASKVGRVLGRQEILSNKQVF